MSKKISELTSATTPLTGIEVVPVLQGGVNKKTTAQTIANLSGVGGVQVANRVFAGPTAGTAAPAAFRALVAADIPALLLSKLALPATQIPFGSAGGVMMSSVDLTYDLGLSRLRLDGVMDFSKQLAVFKFGDINGTGTGEKFELNINQAILVNISNNMAFGINNISPQAALDVVGSAYISEVIKLAPTTFANLPATPIIGMLAHIAGSNTNTWGDTIAGGGAFTVLAFYNGTNWTVMGK